MWTGTCTRNSELVKLWLTAWNVLISDQQLDKGLCSSRRRRPTTAGGITDSDPIHLLIKITVINYPDRHSLHFLMYIPLKFQFFYFRTCNVSVRRNWSIFLVMDNNILYLVFNYAVCLNINIPYNLFHSSGWFTTFSGIYRYHLPKVMYLSI